MSDSAVPKIPVARLIRRPDDLTEDQINSVAAMWWNKHKVDVYTVWVQGIQTQPRQTIMAVMSTCVPSMALHSEPQDERFFNHLTKLFIAGLK